MEQNQPDYLTPNPQQVLPSLPNATAVLVLGILSIVVCFITGIIALVLANRDIALYNANPGTYSASSLSNIKTGRICAIVGISLQLVGLIIYIIFIVAMFSAVATNEFR